MDKQALEYVLEKARVDDVTITQEQGRQSLGALGLSGDMALARIGMPLLCPQGRGVSRTLASCTTNHAASRDVTVSIARSGGCIHMHEVCEVDQVQWIHNNLGVSLYVPQLFA